LNPQRLRHSYKLIADCFKLPDHIDFESWHVIPILIIEN